MLDLQKRMSKGVYKKTHEIVPKTSSGVWCLILGMLQGGSETVEVSAESGEDQVWII